MFLLRPQNADDREARDRAQALRGVKLDGHEWKYVAEGGANVLFRHYPPAATGEKSVFHGKLLRVKKCDAEMSAIAKQRSFKKRSKSKSGRSFSSRSGSLSELELSAAPYHAYYPHPAKVLEYATKDILPYLEKQVHSDGSKEQNMYEQVAQLLEVEQRFLTELNEQLLTLDTRPEHRRQSQIDVSLQCVMVLPDVTLPPPDEDPLMCFDETIDSEGSESGTASEKSAPEEGEDGANGSGTDQTTDEDLFDILSEELEAALIEASSPTAVETAAPVAAAGPSQTSGGSTSAAILTGEPDSNDADGEQDELDDGDDDDDDMQTMPPRRRRVLSGNCNIFDCCFRNICVEIKPKIGFKPKGELLADVKKRVCRFCMHQHYKRATGKVEEISEYCPLDLFSRDPDRIRRALRALERTPQNNFKVFVRSNADEVVNVITGLNADALPKGAAQTKYSCRRKRMGFRHSCQSIGTENDLMLGLADDRDHLLPDVTELLTEVLLRLEILEDLKQMQLLDDISVDGVWHVHRLLQQVRKEAKSDTLLTVGCVVDQLRTNESGKDGEHEEGSLARCVAFLAMALKEVPEVAVPKEVASWRELTVGQLETFYQQLEQRFQVATTLKDCSLLLCLRRAVDDDSGPVTTSTHPPHLHFLSKSSSPLALPAATGSSRKKFEHLREYEHRVVFRDMVFNCVIAIVDLDVKSHKSVDDYFTLDNKIVQHYVNTFGDRMQADECREDK